VTDGKIIGLIVDDEPFDIRNGELPVHPPGGSRQIGKTR
jgi:hypothetical protein